MKTAVLVSSMGGPSNLENIQPFLFNLFNDPAIIRLPAVPRYIVAQLISALRCGKARDIYRLMGGKSPILDNTLAQANAIEKELKSLGEYRCFEGMSYTQPFIKDAVEQAKIWGAQRLIVVPMYPQFSTTTTQSVWRDALAAWGEKDAGLVKSFHDKKWFIDGVAQTANDAAKNIPAGADRHFVFSAHGLPESIVREGDPYPDQCRETARALGAALGLPDTDWTLTYQSRVGPKKWLKPFTDQTVKDRASRGQALVVVPIAFVCEHSETLVELGHEYRNLAMQAGATAYVVAPAIGIKEAFIQGLARHIHEINQNRQ